jgi:hypothetical protein
MTGEKKEMTKDELDQLAHSIAYTGACSLIEGYSINVTADANGLTPEQVGDEPGEWWDLPLEEHQELFADDMDELADAVRYLEARGLLTRYPTNPNWVSLADESEAMR